MTTKKSSPKKKAVAKRVTSYKKREIMTIKKLPMNKFEELLKKYNRKHILKKGRKYYKSIVIDETCQFESTQDMIKNIDKSWGTKGFGKLISENLNQLSTNLSLLYSGECELHRDSFLNRFCDFLLDSLPDIDDTDDDWETHFVSTDYLSTIFEKFKNENINTLQKMEENLYNFINKIRTNEVAIICDTMSGDTLVSTFEELDPTNPYDKQILDKCREQDEREMRMEEQQRQRDLQELARLKRKYEQD